MDVQVSIDSDDEGVSITAQYGLPLSALVLIGVLLPFQLFAISAVPGNERYFVAGPLAFADIGVVLFPYLRRPKMSLFRVTAANSYFSEVRRWGSRRERSIPTSEVGYVSYSPPGRWAPDAMFVALTDGTSKLYMVRVGNSDVDQFKADVRAKFPELESRWERAELAGEGQVIALNIE